LATSLRRSNFSLAGFAQNCPTANFEYNNTCFTQFTQFVSTSTQVEEGSFYQWDFDNDTNYDLITKESTVYWEFPNTGVYTVTLNIQTDDNCSENTQNTQSSQKYFIEITECENCIVKTIVPNNSFESTPTCPETSGLLSTTDKWFSANGSSPDLFSQCAQNEETAIPQNSLGNQTVLSGNAYAGILAYSENQGREYIGIELNEPLTIGLQYFISFKVSLAESSAMGINELGAFFSHTEIIDPANTGRIGAIPQFENQNALTETSDWITVNGNFIATEAYKFLTIGNFSENTTIHAVSGNLEQAYYYIDDVVVNTFFARVEPGKTICPKESVELQAEVNNICEVFWTTEDDPETILSNELKFKVAPTKSINYIFNARNECCLYQDTVHITVKEIQLPNAGADIEICEGEPATLNVTGNGDFTWSPLTGIVDPFSSSTETYPMETITYTLSLTSQQGCEATDDITITVLPKPKIEITNSVVFCQGEPVQILAYAGDDYSYQWSPEEGLSNTNIFNPIAAPLSTTQYSVNVVDQQTNCSAIAYTTVEVKETVNYPNPYPFTICAGSQLELTDVPEATSYSWSPQNNISCFDCANPTITATENTTYTLSLIDMNGCPGKIDFVVEVTERIEVFAGEDQTVCKGQKLNLIANGVPENVAVLWEPSAGLDNPLSHQPIATPSETTLYTLQIIDESFTACANTDSILITLSGEGFADAGRDRFLCAGDAVPLKARGGIKFEWSPAVGLSSTDVFNPVARPEITTAYTVEVTNRSGCTLTDEMIITVDPLPTLTLNQNFISLCDGENTNLEADGTGAFFSWEPTTGLSDASIANPVFTGTESEVYTVYNFNDPSDKCKATAQVEVQVFDESAIETSNNVTVCKGESTELFASGGMTYSWSPVTGLSNAAIANPTATPETTTTYEVTIFNQTCFVNKEITITIADEIMVNAGEDATICSGDSHQLNATGGMDFIWVPSEGLSDPTIANPIASPTKTTTYRVLSGGNNNCSMPDSVTIFVNESVPLEISGTQNVCAGDPVQLSVSGISDGSSYQWVPSEGLSDPTIANPIATPLETITYEVSVSNEAGACLSKGSVLIEVNAAINTEVVANAGEDFTICGGQDAQLTASGGTTYLWIPAAGLSDPTISNPVAILDTTTIFTVLVSNGNEDECPARDEIEIAVEPGVDLILEEGPFEICKGESIELKASGASRYSWSPAESLSDAGIANPIAAPLENTVYTLNASNQRGSCKVVANVAINILDLNAPQIEISEDQVICSNQSVQLNASGGTSYLWSPSIGLDNSEISNPTASPDSTTIYQITVYNNDGKCSSSAQVSVQVNEESNNTIVANAGDDVTICKGQDIQLSATGGINYNWSPITGLDNPFIANPIVSVDSTTTFTLIVSNGMDGECPAKDEITIFVDDDFPLTFTEGPFNICAGESVELFASGAQNYSWNPIIGLNNPSIANPVAAPVESITYTLTASDQTGCEAIKNVTVNVLPNISIETIEDKTICQGDSIELMVNGGTTYQWQPSISLDNPSVSNPVASPEATTVYQVTALGNEENCPSIKEIIIGVISPPSISTSEDVSICAGETVRLNAFNVDGLDIVWSPAEGLDNPLASSPVAAPETSTTYFITANGAMNVGTTCATTDSIVVKVEESIIANAGLDQTICSSGLAQLEASGGENYSWWPTTGLSNPNIANPVATLSSFITYTVTVSNELDNCAQTDNVSVRVEENIIADAGEDISLCRGNEAQLMATGGTTYKWTPADGLSNPNIANPIAKPETSTTYSVLVSNGNEALCSDMDEITIEVEEGFNLVFDEGPYEICEGESLQLSASGGGTYRWSPNEEISNIFVGNPVVSPTESTIYTLKATNLDGTCAVEKSTTVYVQPKIELLTETEYTICSGDMLQFNVAGASTYNWSPDLYLSNHEIGNPTANPTENISYTITGSNTSCMANTTINVTVEASPELNISEDLTICSGSSAQLNATGNDMYIWTPVESLNDPSVANPVATPDVTTTYQVSYGNSNCAKTKSVTVYVDNSTIPRLCTQPVLTKFICPDEFCGIRENDVFTELDNTYFFCSLDINEEGCIEYTALPLFFGTDTISIIACNNVNNEDCINLTAIMSVVEDCEAEICSNPVVSLPCTQSGETIEICPKFCLFDQSEETDISDYSIINFTLNSEGTVDLNGNCFSYTSSESFIGPEVIRLTACSTIYPDYCDEATFVLDVLSDCGLKIHPPIQQTDIFKEEDQAEEINYDLVQKNLMNINIYPVTTKNVINYQLQNTEAGKYSISINTINGQTLHTEKIYLYEGLQQQQLVIDYLDKGIYFISIQKDNIFISEKFIVLP